MKEQDRLVYYKGPFDDVILLEIGDKIQEKVLEDPKNGKRLFAVFLELAQNISIYSAEKEEKKQLESIGKWGVGVLAVYETAEKYALMASNMVRNDMLETIVMKCNEINTLDREGLRAMKREYRSAEISPGHKGGNIGLIQVALKSDLPIEIEQKKIDETYSFFTILVNIIK